MQPSIAFDHRRNAANAAALLPKGQRQQRNPNDYILDRLTQVKSAVVALKKRGFVVVGIDLSHGIKPTVQIQYCRQCQQLIATDEAAYYKHITGAAGRERWGQLDIENCRVVWREMVEG